MFLATFILLHMCERNRTGPQCWRKRVQQLKKRTKSFFYFEQT